MSARGRVLLAATALLLAAAAAFAIPTVWGRPWRLDHFYLRVFLEVALDRPMLLSQLRVLEPWGLHFHSDDLDDFSVEFQRESARKRRGYAGTLASYARPEDPSAALSYDVLEWFLATGIAGEPFLLHDYPVNQLDGVQSTLPDFMLNVHQVRTPRDARNYVARLAGFGTALSQVEAGLRERAQRGTLPPRFVFDRVLEEIEGFLAPPPAEHVLVASFAERLDALPEPGGGARDARLAGARREVEHTVYPAYRSLAGTLAELRGAAGEADGVWRLPDGEAYYAWLLRQHTTTLRSADEIHALGLAEVERIHAEMRAILEGEGLPADDPAAAIRALNDDPRFLYPDSDAGRERVLADYRAILDDARTRLPELFGRLPRADVEVERVPVFKEAGAAGAYYQPPPFDGSKPGVFYANLRAVREIPKFGMRTLAYHEALPGHHLQVALAQELEGLPFFRRVLPFTAYLEGWALYAERLALEEGFHPTPYDRLGALVAEVFRAVRLVVDTGIHARRWSRERAIAYMLANTGMPETDVVAEVERYVVLPGQACAYKIGQLEILALRERARRALGGAFSLREFHDVVLGAGALPLTLLERRVDAWLAAARGR